MPKEEKCLSHIGADNQPKMVDVSSKTSTRREAVAEGDVFLPEEVARLFKSGEIMGPKGPVFQTAIIAGTQAAKKTAELIPFCHPLALENVSVQISMESKSLVKVVARAVTTGKTGVEMEALSAVSGACLTIYDMCKAVSHDIVIKNICLMGKTGGKSDFNRAGSLHNP